MPTTFVRVLSLLLALAFLLTGGAKLAGVRMIEESTKALNISHRLHVAVGLLEIAAAAGLVVGLWWPPLRLAAAAGLTLLMVGAIVYHVRARDKAANTAAPAVLGAPTLAAVVISLSA